MIACRQGGARANEPRYGFILWSSEYPASIGHGSVGQLWYCALEIKDSVTRQITQSAGPVPKTEATSPLSQLGFLKNFNPDKKPTKGQIACFDIHECVLML